MKIQPLHEVTDQNKLQNIIKSMEINGWVGRPVLVVDCGDYYQAITGTHRIAAANEVGIDIEYFEIEQPEYTGDDEVTELFCTLIEGDDEDRLDALVDLVEMGLVEQGALDIMREENI